MTCIFYIIVLLIINNVAWFLVWRNNKSKFVAALEGIDDSAIANSVKKLLKKK